jgi:chaperonin GroES
MEQLGINSDPSQMDLMSQMQLGMQEPVQPEQPQAAPDSLSRRLESTNIAEDLDEDKLNEISELCKKGYEADLTSRSHWEKDLEDWTKLAIQVKEDKTYPWPHASNIKFPLLSTAAMQFSARAYPTLIPSDNRPVKCRVVGKDPEGLKASRALRVSEHMSYQLTEEMVHWEEDMDRLLIVLSIAGTCFKKTYWDALEERNESCLVLPKDLVVNYWTRHLDKADRVSQKIWMTKNKYQERVNAKLFREVDLGEPSNEEEIVDKTVNRQFTVGEEDFTTPYLFIEQHTWLDLDDDGYAEPYIVTFDLKSGEILRIVARFDEEGIKTDEEGNLIKIEPVQYFTKYGFLPNPDGGFYDLGFGALLGPLNDSANTVVNQLVDAGSLANLQTGFISKGLRLKMGDSRFQPGEWKAVNATGEDLKKGIFPLPVRDPSNVLFQLLQLLITSTKELASVAEIFVGKMPGQNTPASTTMATIEQGMKVFTAIFKRVYRSFTSELRKIYRLNKLYIDPQQYQDVLDDPASAMDYNGPTNDIVPAADPQAISDTVKQMKAENLLQLMQTGILDPNEVVKRVLEAQGQPDIQALFKKEQAGPSPEQQKMQMEMQIKQQEAQMNQQEMQMKLQTEQQLAQIKVQVEQAKLQIEQMKLELEKQKAQFELQKMGMEMDLTQQSMQLDHQSEMHKMQMGQMKDQAKMESDLRMMDHKEKLAKRGANTDGNKQGRVPAVERKSSNKGGVRGN